MRLLIDTNIVIALFRDDSSASHAVEASDGVFVPVVVLAELYFGAFSSARVQSNVSRIKHFISENNILNCDEDTSRYFGQIKANLRSKGTPIPENDIWIAALAVQHDLTLLTRDAHFSLVENLALSHLG